MVKAIKAFLDELCDFGEQVQKAVATINPQKAVATINPQKAVATINPQKAVATINPPRGLTTKDGLQYPGADYVVVEKRTDCTYYWNELTYNGITFQIGVMIEKAKTLKRELYISFYSTDIKNKFTEESEIFSKPEVKGKINETWFKVKDPLNAEFFQDGTTDTKKVEILEKILTAVCAELDKP